MVLHLWDMMLNNDGVWTLHICHLEMGLEYSYK